MEVAVGRGVAVGKFSAAGSGVAVGSGVAAGSAVEVGVRVAVASGAAVGIVVAAGRMNEGAADSGASWQPASIMASNTTEKVVAARISGVSALMIMAS